MCGANTSQFTMIRQQVISILPIGFLVIGIAVSTGYMPQSQRPYLI